MSRPRSGDDEGAAGEGPGDPGGDVDRLGPPGQVGGLGDRGAEQLRRPDALDAGRLGPLGLGLEVGDRGPDRGDRDPLQRAAHPAGLDGGRLGGLGQHGVGDPLPVPLGVAEHRRVRLAALQEEVEVVLPGEADPPWTWIAASGTRQPASDE